MSSSGPRKSCTKFCRRRRRSAEVIEFGQDFQDALEHARHLAKESRLHFIDSFSLTLVQGVASYALELFRSVPNLDYVYVPIGMGSGICGTIATRNALGLQTRIVGVVSSGAPAYALSFQAGKPVSNPTPAYLRQFWPVEHSTCPPKRPLQRSWPGNLRRRDEK
jgi:threonine dehydratase